MDASTNANPMEESQTKYTQMKSSKKSAKSRTKSNKSEENKKSLSGAGGSSSNSAVNTDNTNASGSAMTRSYPNESNNLGMSSNNNSAVHHNSSNSNNNNASSNNNSGSNNAESSGTSNSSRGHHKGYTGLDGRSIQVIWEQHDQGDMELQADVCERLAEDASYKLWELINNIKTYARHSGGTVTYDLVNEVLVDADVPPMLGAMDTSWERIDCGDSYFFYSDKIIELREEYQREINITMPDGPDYLCSWPVDDQNTELLKKYIPPIIYVTVHGDTQAFDTVLSAVASSPLMGSSYRVILFKIIEILAFKQYDSISLRCWRLLRALAINPFTRDVSCREELFHLAEILICQAMAPFETIKVHGLKNETPTEHFSDHFLAQTLSASTSASQAETATTSSAAGITITTSTNQPEIRIDDLREELIFQEVKNEVFTAEELFGTQNANDQCQPEEKIYRLINDDDDEMGEIELKTIADASMISQYFASPIDWDNVNDLCQTIGHLAAVNGFFQSECLFHVIRRLERFFEGRNISTEREYNYISRAIRVLTSLGEFAFREFIPFIYKFDPDNVPEHLWIDFAPSAIFLNGPDDIFLYEWLEYLCGADKLQPFLIYYAQYHEQMLTFRFINRRLGTFKISPKFGVRRLEWSTIAAAMCHGDDPNKALKPKPTINDYFPDKILPNLNLNRAGTIRFKFSGCRPIIIKPKVVDQQQNQQKLSNESEGMDTTTTPIQKDILIARRKLYKSLSDERRVIPLSSYHFIRI